MENRNATGEKSFTPFQVTGIALLVGIFSISAQYSDSLQLFTATQIPESLIWEISGGIVVILSLLGLKRHYADDEKVTSES